MKTEEKTGKSKLSLLKQRSKYFKRYQREEEIKRNINYWKQKLRGVENEKNS